MSYCLKYTVKNSNYDPIDIDQLEILYNIPGVEDFKFCLNNCWWTPLNNLWEKLNILVVRTTQKMLNFSSKYFFIVPFARTSYCNSSTEMVKSFLIITILFITLGSFAQTKTASSELNFDFENVENGLPVGWDIYGSKNYTIAVDSINVKSGQYSASIEFNGNAPDFKALAFSIPTNYAGKKITLSGYIKTENIEEGFAGLWMRIDPGIAFDNMQEKRLKGTTDWTKYEITLEMNPEKTERIVVGGIMVGKGKIWLDDFSVTIDGKDIGELKPFERKVFPAELDTEFNEGSQITNIVADERQIANLKTLGLIWGFLKYHHPAIAKGEYNWDYELFRILPKILDAKNTNDRDAILVKWINSFGELPKGKKVKIKSSTIKTEPDLNWIEQSNFSNELTGLLLKVKNAKRPSESYYIGLQPGVNNPEFKNEDPYFSLKYPDAGYRILSLYRYWNIIQYYFPYKNLIEEDWKGVLEEFIPTFIAAKDETEYTLASLEIIGRVHDTHANIWSSSEVLNDYWGNNYTALELTFIENKAVVTGYFDDYLGERTGLKIGDVITSINYQSVEEIVKERLPLTPASNHSAKLRNIARNLLRTNQSAISVTFVRDEKSEIGILAAFSKDEINISRRFIDRDTCFKLINKDIAYINNGTLQVRYISEIWEQIKNTKGLIIDIRNYPTDFLVFELSRYLLPKSTPFVKFTKGNIENPGFFTFTKALKVGNRNRNYYNGKIIILTNETSQSSAEYHAMAYRVHPNAIVLGSTTAGADGNVSRFYLPGGVSTMITGIGVYYPDGGETQRIGIVPDIELRPTVEGIKEGRDELMERAIEIIEGK